MEKTKNRIQKIGIVLAFVFTGFATMNKARKDFVSNRTFEKLLDLW